MSWSKCVSRTFVVQCSSSGTILPAIMSWIDSHGTTFVESWQINGLLLLERSESVSKRMYLMRVSDEGSLMGGDVISLYSNSDEVFANINDVTIKGDGSLVSIIGSFPNVHSRQNYEVHGATYESDSLLFRVCNSFSISQQLSTSIIVDVGFLSCHSWNEYPETQFEKIIDSLKMRLLKVEEVIIRRLEYSTMYEESKGFPESFGKQHVMHQYACCFQQEQ